MYKLLSVAITSILLIACSADDTAVPRPAIEQFKSGKTTAQEVERVIGGPVSTLPLTDGSARYQWVFQQSGFSGTDPETKVMTATVHPGGVLSDISVSGSPQ